MRQSKQHFKKSEASDGVGIFMPTPMTVAGFDVGVFICSQTARLK